VFAQIVTVLIFLLMAGWLVSNMLQALERLGLMPSLSFMDLTSQFDIGQPKGMHGRDDPYWNAFRTGLYNTARVSLFGIVLATIWGTALGIAGLSSNLLVARISRYYIDLLRGIPLLILMIFVHKGIFIKFPGINDAIMLGDSTFITNRGIYFVGGTPTESTDDYLRILLIAVLAAALLAALLVRRGKQTGRLPMTTLWTLVVFFAISAVGWLLLSNQSNPPWLPDLPYVKGLNIKGGIRLTPEFSAVLFSLVIYTASFVAETVRAGIMSVSKGQREAARSLGLSGLDTLRLVIMPQAMRVIVPPLTSIWLSLTKNSSLALAVGYPDLVAVAGTIQMQSGRAVEVWTGLVMVTYVSLSLLTSLFGNWYNRKMAIVER